MYPCENEQIDDLQYKGLKIIQDKNGFRFGTDAVLLSDFADIREGAKVLDMGTGTGIIPILVAGKTGAQNIIGLEIQEHMAQMAQRSVEMNGLSQRIRIVHGDIKKSVELFGLAKFDVVVCNPPYVKFGGGLMNPSDNKAISRHEILCTLEDVVSSAARLLVPGGQLALVHRPQRLVDVLCLMRSFSIEPKHLRFVHPSPHKKPQLILVKGTKGGNAELKMMDPLYIYEEDGNYSREIYRIYSRDMEMEEGSR